MDTKKYALACYFVEVAQYCVPAGQAARETMKLLLNSLHMLSEDLRSCAFLKSIFEREEDDILSDFDIVLNACNESGDKSLWNKVILISHNPPKNTICDAVNPELHVGSQKFADFILENQPLAVITGHVHEGKGVEKIGNTIVINPGALMEGNYAWLEVKKSGDSWIVVSASLESVGLN